jgi:hypothetical protein
MSNREESVSTRDLASTPADDTDRATDQREETGTESRDGAVATDDRSAAEREDATAQAPADEDRRDDADKRDDEDTALLPHDQGTEFQERWESIQVTFVDDPRDAVETADALVAELMQRLADGFAQERERLERQWSRGEDVSTEDLRVVLQRYRSFFRRLLSA